MIKGGGPEEVMAARKQIWRGVNPSDTFLSILEQLKGMENYNATWDVQQSAKKGKLYTIHKYKVKRLSKMNKNKTKLRKKSNVNQIQRKYSVVRPLNKEIKKLIQENRKKERRLETSNPWRNHPIGDSGDPI